MFIKIRKLLEYLILRSLICKSNCKRIFLDIIYSSYFGWKLNPGQSGRLQCLLTSRVRENTKFLTLFSFIRETSVGEAIVDPDR